MAEKTTARSPLDTNWVSHYTRAHLGSAGMHITAVLPQDAPSGLPPLALLPTQLALLPTQPLSESTGTIVLPSELWVRITTFLNTQSTFRLFCVSHYAYEVIRRDCFLANVSQWTNTMILSYRSFKESIRSVPRDPGLQHTFMALLERRRASSLMASSDDMDDGCLEIIAQNCPGLTKFCVEASPITDTALSCLLKNCTALTHLSIDRCEMITAIGLAAIRERGQWKNLCLRLPHVIDDVHLTAIMKQCSGLETLDVATCTAISNLGAASIAQHCTGMKALNLSGCIGVTGVGLAAIAERCKELTALKLQSIATDAGLTIIARECTKLQELDLAGCLSLSGCGSHDESQSDTGPGMGLASVGLYSRSLKEFGCSATHINIGALGTILLSCEQLEKLDISWCKVSNAVTSVIELFAKNLKELNISGTPIVDTGLAGVINKCDKLEEIYALVCDGVTQQSVDHARAVRGEALQVYL